MKNFFLIFLLIFGIISCGNTQNLRAVDDKGLSKIENDKITIANPDLEYEVIIFDSGFESWFRIYAKQRGFYSLSFLENKNRIWVNEWNSRSRSARKGYDYTIDYNSTIKYGLEVNYMLYNYLLYWQETNKIKLN